MTEETGQSAKRSPPTASAVKRSVQEIPSYLAPYIVQQNASLYTPIDQASWRFILKLSQKYFKNFAHQKYLDGLRETGISVERIPLISEMNEKLALFGWQAVAVSGFIPPGVFMEFLALGVLPIACDMRKIENLAYTPAPDIVHEAAGHAPIIADPSYANYLLSYGELARKAIFSSQDMEVYNAIRHLSDTKERPDATESEIAEADARLDAANASVTYDSEATELSRMAWWTFEYGLVGSLDDPKIFGAGLLSSMSESFHCLSSKVKKVPFSLDCVHQTYDITRPQPQLFVARDFNQLIDALHELGKSMAFSRGGAFGLNRAKQAATVTTSEFDSGLQISGVVSDFITSSVPFNDSDNSGEPAYLQFKGPTQLSYQDQQLPGQGADYHREGFGSPVGELEDGFLPSAIDEAALWKMGFGSGKKGILKFKSGVEVSGALKEIVRRDGKTLVIAFTDCTVRLITRVKKTGLSGKVSEESSERILFDPAWGVFDMACGVSVRSVFGGAADRKEYLAVTGGFHQEPGQPKTNLTAANKALNDLYAQVKTIRDRIRGQAAAQKISGEELARELNEVSLKLDAQYPRDWLLRYEMLELALGETSAVGKGSHESLKIFAQMSQEKMKQIAQSDQSTGNAIAEMIGRGLAAIGNE